MDTQAGFMGMANPMWISVISSLTQLWSYYLELQKKTYNKQRSELYGSQLTQLVEHQIRNFRVANLSSTLKMV